MITGTKIRHIRQMRGLKQQDVAHQISMSQQAYSRLENDRSKPTYDQLKRITDVLNVSMEDLEKWDGKSVFYNYGNHSNGQINNHKSLSEEERNLYQQLLAQKEYENHSLKGELAYFRATVDKLLPTKNEGRS
jgi:transcriptional regulator with XRE-family HTH domain